MNNENLKISADKIENFGYSRPFTDSEMEQMRVDFTDISLELKDLQEELKNISKDLKEQIKPIKEKVGDVLKKLHEKSEFVTKECAVFYDQEAGKAEYFDLETGDKIHTRTLFPNERQMSIASEIRKTGTK